MIAKIKDNLLLFVILAGAFFVRVWGTAAYRFNGDEMENLIIAQGGSLAEVCRRRLIELHPPLADILHHYLQLFTSDMAVLRLFSVFAGMVVVIGFYRLGALLQGRALGLFYAFCNAFAPIAVVTSATYRNYPLFMAFTVWALYYFFLYQQTLTKKYLCSFILLITLASATHFSGFLVAAICGISAAAFLLKDKDWKNTAILALSYFLLAALAAVFYYYYYAGLDATALRWKNLGLAAGLVQQGLGDKFAYTFFGIFIYFFPIISFINGGWFEAGGLWRDALVAGGALSIALYIMGMKILYSQNRKLFWFLIVAWSVAVAASLSNIYPISITRHNYYFEPFFILPFGFLIARYVPGVHFSSAFKNLFACGVFVVALVLGITQLYLKNEGEFSLTTKDYADAQQYLKSQVGEADTIVSGHEGSYLYLLYDKDGGMTSYDAYGDFPYVNNSTVFTNSPFNALDQQSFHTVLMAHAKMQAAKAGGQLWFVMYGWKNAEIWRIWKCHYLRDKVQHFFSREGVLIFSVNVFDMLAFANNANEWGSCLPATKPDLSATAFKQVSLTPVP